MKQYEYDCELNSRWFSGLPSRWLLYRVKNLITQNDAGAWGDDPTSENETICLRVADMDFALGVFKTKNIDNLTRRAYSQDQIDKLTLKQGDILIEKSGGGEKTPVGRSVYFDKEYKALFANFMQRLRVRTELITPRYFAFLLHAMYRNGVTWYYVKQTTGIQNLDLNRMLAEEKFPVPPRAEQDQIVRYLDWQVSKINRLIAAKKKQIELLEEKKKRAIQEAFCKTGSHCNIEQLLETIREWLPEGWASPLLGQVISSIEQGWSPNAGDDIDDPNQWHVLTLSAVKHGSFVKTACKPIDINATIPVYLELKDGDLLLTRSNTRNLVGDVCIVYDADPQTIFSDLIYRLVVKPEYALSRYLMYYLLSPFARIQIERAAKGSSGTMPKLSHADIRRIRIVLPPIEIQESICNELDKTSAAIDTAIERINTQINHTLELRTRLISDVVTGQVDVRGIEVPEYEPVEDITDEQEDEQEGETYEE